MKLKRNTFLYMEPKEEGKDFESFAECGSCYMFKGDTCLIHGPKLKVTSESSCNLYVPGKPITGHAGKHFQAVTSDDSGLVDRPVRCENCVSYIEEDSVCMFFRNLNEKVPDLFDLEEEVDPYGCCNAQRPLEENSY